mmetsp:Transcript_21585/g.30234  ORF Transcript_21585/g.30234 Transcript_21585/m.30234 type:complete len:149 (+) Transcript_21585:1643-2089(+)
MVDGESLRYQDFTKEEKKQALRYLIFMTRKKCGRIKTRGCDDGRPMRIYTDKNTSSSPTVALETVFLTCEFSALKRRHVVTIDLPGAFMFLDMDKIVILKVEGDSVEALLEVNYNKYVQYVAIENGHKVIYFKLKRALYGALRVALLF